MSNRLPWCAGGGYGQNVSHEDNPRVFLDISVDGEPVGKLIIELFANIVPRTAENFRLLCTGEKGYGKVTGKPLHYKGTVFHRIRKGLLAQGGDISWDKDGRGGESVYGGYFEDENFQLRHTEPGMLSMGNRGGDTNGSRFYITFMPLQLLDGLHVVFGKIIKGMPTLYYIDEMGTPGGKPAGVVQITDCGVIGKDTGKISRSLNTATSDERVKEHNDEREKQRKYPSSEGLLQISEGGQTSEDKSNVMESDQVKKIKYLKRASSSDGLKEHSDEREKQRKYSSSEGLLQITNCGQIVKDEDKGLPRQQVGDDSIMELRQQIDWMMKSIREIARAGDVHLPDYPSTRPQQDELARIHSDS